MSQFVELKTVDRSEATLSSLYAGRVVQRVHDARSRPPARGEALLAAGEKIFLKLNRWVETALAPELNPFAQMGAVANTNFFIALVTGVILLFWYSPSVNHAYQSLESMPFFGQLMRSLHRYSSDACLLFVLLHAFQTLFAGKFSGPRWLAWVSGVFLIGVLWLDGWLGYWLVWDERGRLVAQGSARLIDALPLFPDPLSRSLLTPDTVHSLLFFLVFFLHMLLPLAMGIALWLHIMRLHKSVFFTGKRLTLAILLALLVISLIVPATSAEPANLQRIQPRIQVDYFYLLPLYLTERLSGGTLWFLSLMATVLAASVPWWLPARRQREAPAVLEERCNGCEQCFQDCPFNAISMVPTEGGRAAVKSVIDPVKCVACGVCVGSCDPAGILYPMLEPLAVRRWVNQLLSANGDPQLPANLAFICAESAGAELKVDERGHCPELPEYHVLPVPCIGWVHPLLVERALRRGARRVLLVGCGSDPYCRKGNLWTEERLEGLRKPAFRKEKFSRADVALLELNRAQREELLQQASAFARGMAWQPGKAPRWRSLAVAALLLIGLSVAAVGPSNVPLPPGKAPDSELVVTFQLAGEFVEEKPAPASAQEDLLPHMRSPQAMERERVPVRMRLFVDDRLLLEKSYRPTGLFNDGTSVAMERLPLPAGRHRIRVEVSNSADPSIWNFVDERTLEFLRGLRHVVRLEKGQGFRWY